MEIQSTVTGAMSALWTKIAIFLPNLLVGIAIIVGGYLVARVVQRLAAALAVRLGIDRASERSGVREMLDASGVAVAPSAIIGRTAFLFALLLFAISAAESFGLTAVSGTIDSFILFLPKVFAALVIALLGLYLAQIVSDAVRRATEGFGIDYAGALGGVARGVIVLVVVTLAVAQLDIDTGVLYLIIGITMAVAGVAIALSLGFGTRRIASDIVSGVYARDDLQPGDVIEADGVRGEVLEVGSVMTVIELADGRHRHIPNSRLMSRPFDVIPERAESGEGT